MSIDAPLTVSTSVTVTASDPEGDAITYEAFFLQDGMSFNASTHTLTWTPSVPAGTKFYVKFRVSTNTWPNASGGTDAIIAQFTVTSPPEGGCPFVDTRTAAGWQEENSILDRSLTGALSLDAYRLKSSPEVRDGRYQLRLRENEREFTTLDQVRLVTVDHDPSVRAWPRADQVILGTRVPPHRVTTSKGADITNLVDGSGSSYFVGEPGETLLVELRNPAEATQGGESHDSADPDPFEIDPGCKGPCEGGGGLVAVGPESEARTTDAAILGSTGILIQGQDAGGLWRTVRQRYPREHFDEFLIDTLDQGPVRLVFIGRHKLRYVGRVLPVADALIPQALPLLAARHSRLGDVRLAVLGSGGVSTLLAPGDTITFDFTATSVPAAQARDFFLLAKGVYTSVQPERQGAIASFPPTRFALMQNQPNPFARTTVIHFELPQPGHVRLEVFDLQGRSVRVLVDKDFQPGRWSSEWDSRNSIAHPVEPGIYLYRITAGRYRAEGKMVLLP